MLEHTFEQTCYLVSTKRNKYGDIDMEGSEAVSCRFRKITELDKMNNREDIRADAWLWVRAGELVEEGGVVRFEDEYYRIKRVLEARRLRGNKVFFKKCLLDKYSQVSDEAS